MATGWWTIREDGFEHSTYADEASAREVLAELEADGFRGALSLTWRAL